MKASDFIVEYFISKGITDIFGYPGGMVTHLIDSLRKYEDKISAHLNYNEQASAFAACGYAQSTGKTGVAYATSGPGATNLITGICNAYFDSIPVVFLTGQVNSFEQNNLSLRQRGFQETDIVSLVKPVTKYATKINNVEELQYNLDKAFYIANEGRKGPVLLDIAMDVQRSEFTTKHKFKAITKEYSFDANKINELLEQSSRPVLLVGNGCVSNINKINTLGIPVVSSMLAFDVPQKADFGYGFIGAYGHRAANFIVSKADLIISLGARLDIRQVGLHREKFAPNAQIIRVDIDRNELNYQCNNNDILIQANAEEVLNTLETIKKYQNWLDICNEISDKLNIDGSNKGNEIINQVSKFAPDYSIVCTDVGQNQVWVAQSFNVKKNQKFLFSGGHAAMGYSLPAAIGCSYKTNKTIISFNGDGGFQMNLQELNTVARDNLNIKIVILNNNALGMIRHFQEMYFDSKYFQTVDGLGYSNPDFKKIAEAYGISYCNTINKEIFNDIGPAIIDVSINEPTYVVPKLEFGRTSYDQSPLIDRNLLHYLEQL